MNMLNYKMSCIIILSEVELMKCLNNMERLQIANDTMMKLLTLYEYKGKDYYFENILKSSLNQIIKQTIERDTFYIGKLMNLDITPYRYKLIIKKDSNPKTNDEKILRNVKNVFKIIAEDSDKFELTSNEFLRLAIKIYKEVKNISYVSENKTIKVNLIEEKKRESRRKGVEEMLKEYILLVNSDQYELTQIVTNFYIDFINLSPFNEGNEIVGLLIIYLLLLKEQFKMFHYVSFFEMIYEEFDEFKGYVNKANFNWKDGYSQTNPLNNFLIDLLIEGYKKVDKLSEDTKFDKNIAKTYNIENTIMKMNEVFTKEDIREKHPYVSLSTIDRTLKRMRDENKIRPNGVGRSATWVRITNYERFEAQSSKQMSLFDIIMQKEEDE